MMILTVSIQLLTVSVTPGSSRLQCRCRRRGSYCCHWHQLKRCMFSAVFSVSFETKLTVLWTDGTAVFVRMSRHANPALYWAKLTKASSVKWSLHRCECFVGVSKSARFVCTNLIHFRKTVLRLSGKGCSDTFPFPCLAVQFAAAQNAGILHFQKTPVQRIPNLPPSVVIRV